MTTKSSDWDGVAAWLADQAEQIIETSCARVFLADDLAWKIKRPVDFGFLDFSTREKRKRAIERELELNRGFAVDAPGEIYRAVRKVTRQDGGLRLDGEGEAVEWLLEMRRFDPAAVLSERPEAVDVGLAEAIGRLIGRAHIATAAVPKPGLDAWLYTVDLQCRAAYPILPRTRSIDGPSNG